jgi:hypothetical protein
MVANFGTMVMELNMRYDRSTGKLVAKGLAVESKEVVIFSKADTCLSKQSVQKTRF